MPQAVQQLARQAGSLAFKAAGTALGLARSAAEQVLGPAVERVLGRDGAGREEPDRGWPFDRRAAPTDTPTARPGPRPPTAEEAVAAERAEPRGWEADDTERAPPPDPALEHVSEEATLAAESADPGAADGAGPEITVAPPWPGYDEMRARDVVDRLAAATPDVAATVRLYESANKRRKTVLQAAERATRA